MYRLIIADDEESIRNGIAHSLPWREWGYEVCALCSDGQEVLEQLKLVHPDVVLSDIRMPGMDGVELMQRLSSAYPDVKIVILSGYSDFEYLNMSIKNHVAEYLEDQQPAPCRAAAPAALFVWRRTAAHFIQQ